MNNKKNQENTNFSKNFYTFTVMMKDFHSTTTDQLLKKNNPVTATCRLSNVTDLNILTDSHFT